MKSGTAVPALLRGRGTSPASKAFHDNKRNMKQSLVRVSQFAKSRRLAALCSLVLALSTGWSSAQAAELDETGTLWGPVIEWSLNNSSWSGNPFDLEAYATFVH